MILLQLQPVGTTLGSCGQTNRLFVLPGQNSMSKELDKLDTESERTDFS